MPPAFDAASCTLTILAIPYPTLGGPLKLECSVLNMETTVVIGSHGSTTQFVGPSSYIIYRAQCKMKTQDPQFNVIRDCNVIAVRASHKRRGLCSRSGCTSVKPARAAFALFMGRGVVGLRLASEGV